MKTRFLFPIAILLLFSSVTYGQNTPFSGVWKLNKEKSVFDPNQLYLSGITINLRADSLLTTRVYATGDGQEYPFEENLRLDGKDCKIVIYDMPRTTKALFSAAKDSIKMESVTTFNGNNGEQNLNVKETLFIENGGETLTILFSNSIAGSLTTGRYSYGRVKK
jgi:hypothetical protein